MTKKNRCLAQVIAFLSLLILSDVSFSDDNKAQLNALETEIDKQENKLKNQKIEKDKLNSLLQKQNQEINALELELKAFKTDLDVIDDEIKSIETQISKINQSIIEQKALLLKQIEMAFMQGQSSTMEMLFSSENTQRNDRVVGYIGYLNRAREKTIEIIQTQEIELREKQDDIKAKKSQQETLIKEQNVKLEALEAVKLAHSKTISQIKSQMSKTEDELVSLRDDQINLQYKIQQATREAERQAAALAAESLSKSQTSNPSTGKMLSQSSNSSGKTLPKPVDGAIIINYGEQLGGEIMSKGWVISAAYGQSVKAVQSGKVLIADYLQGYGNVIVIDHGAGYMSLYGYNSEMLVKQGDDISIGKVISKVGQREGESDSGLYFEIRKEGEAVNPITYLNN
ncbi:peptidoglycan DD-metalloendopeptidase family protein [Thorsellia anophelis]|uniref:Septal ring factor EnvC, activator of murein hydrolases AmiA and AmiB n=1 Tax=Thorsellia anophelis DSM 18579 TaxID=1123402 RepID=A0A1H9YU36_9GAMM|nr:peptidoglycan DD-metalloendopeptidase family protein [Thorsellia anophelis]SES72678.1 Septal ring factor EnvC, activator of murein hydrolases AmiA and AmiB [Thorsellia anophelis DSM 18579]